MNLFSNTTRSYTCNSPMLTITEDSYASVMCTGVVIMKIIIFTFRLSVLESSQSRQ